MTERTRPSVKAQAPEALKPTGQWKTKDALIKHFKETRARNIAYIKDHYPEMRQHFMDQPPAGLLDAYQWLLFQGAHSKRHTAQIVPGSSLHHSPRLQEQTPAGAVPCRISFTMSR